MALMAAEGISPEALSLQLAELALAEGAEADPEYAFHLQLEEALQNSLQSLPDLELTAQLPTAEEPTQTSVALQLQVRARQAGRAGARQASRAAGYL